MARAQPDPALLARRALIATGLAVFVCWNLGTAIGAASGRRARRPAPARPRRDAARRIPGAARAAPRPAAGAPHRRRRRPDRPRHGADRPGRLPIVAAGTAVLILAAARGADRTARVTWVAIGALAAISFGLKMLGPVLVGDRALSPRAPASS